jgi:hypothetical protein
VDEGDCGGDHAQVRLPSHLISGTLVYCRAHGPLYICIQAGFVAMPSSCTVLGRVTMPWQPMVTPATPLAPASSSPSKGSLKRLVTSRPTLLGVSAQMRGVGIPVSNSQTYLHSHHSLDSIADRMTTAAGATVSNVVGMISTEAGLSVELAAMKSQWCVSPNNALLKGCQPFPVVVFFLLASISSTRQMRSSRRHTYIFLACNASSLTGSQGILPPTTPSRSKTTRGFN